MDCKGKSAADKSCCLCRQLVSDYLNNSKWPPRLTLYDRPGRWFRKYGASGSWYRYHSLQQLQENMSSGCKLCGLICRSITVEPASLSLQYENLEISVSGNDSIITIHTPWKESLNYEFCCHQPRKPPTSNMLQRSGREGTRIGRMLEPSSQTDGCFNLIRLWLQKCFTVHRNSPSPSTVLPTRVIDVGIQGESEPRLLSSKDIEGPYITLSYCWGGDIAFKTVKSNLKTREHSVPLDTMPKTFQDAIFVCRKLDIQYLWVGNISAG